MNNYALPTPNFPADHCWGVSGNPETQRGWSSHNTGVHGLEPAENSPPLNTLGWLSISAGVKPLMAQLHLLGWPPWPQPTVSLAPCDSLPASVYGCVIDKIVRYFKCAIWWLGLRIHWESIAPSHSLYDLAYLSFLVVRTFTFYSLSKFQLFIVVPTSATWLHQMPQTYCPMVASLYTFLPTTPFYSQPLVTRHHIFAFWFWVWPLPSFLPFWFRVLSDNMQ